MRASDFLKKEKELYFISLLTEFMESDFRREEDKFSFEMGEIYVFEKNNIQRQFLKINVALN